MNIKKDINRDRELFYDLMKATFVKIEVGSKMYGLEHKDSDTDLLCIYNTSKRELNMFDRSSIKYNLSSMTLIICLLIYILF